MKQTRDYAEEFEDRARSAVEDVRRAVTNTGFYRSSRNRILGGVCGGIAEKFGIDPTLVRLGAVLLVLFGSVGLWVYALLWAIIPLNEDYPELSETVLDDLPPMPHSGPYVDVPGMDPVGGPFTSSTTSSTTAPTPPSPTPPSSAVPNADTSIPSNTPTGEADESPADTDADEDTDFPKPDAVL